MGRRLQTTAAIACIKMFLMIFNFLFWLTGIGILAAGIWMKVSLYRYMELSTDYNYLAPYVLIGIGAVIVIIGSLACCCTMKGQSFMLYLYAVFLLIVFVMMLTVGISGYFYKSKLGKGFRTGLNDTVIDYGIGNDKMRDQALDMLQANLVCCGVGSYEDWFSTRWANNSRSVPVSCCIHQNHLCRHLDIRGNNVSTISTDGCYRKVLDFVNSNLSAIGGGVLGIAFFQLFGVIFAYCLARNVNRGKYEPVD